MYDFYFEINSLVRHVKDINNCRSKYRAYFWLFKEAYFLVTAQEKLIFGWESKPELLNGIYIFVVKSCITYVDFLHVCTIAYGLKDENFF